MDSESGSSRFLWEAIENEKVGEGSSLEEPSPVCVGFSFSEPPTDSEPVTELDLESLGVIVVSELSDLGLVIFDSIPEGVSFDGPPKFIGSEIFSLGSELVSIGFPVSGPPTSGESRGSSPGEGSKSPADAESASSVPDFSVNPVSVPCSEP